MSEVQEIKLDRMRYTKNTTSSRLALLAIVFDVLFFISIYKSNVGTWYYNILMGASIIYNLVFMLAAFLSSVNNEPVMGTAQFIRVMIYLVLSAACLFAGAVINLNKSRALASRIASLEAGKA